MTDEQLPPIEEDIELVRRFTAPLLERIAELERQLEEAKKDAEVFCPKCNGSGEMIVLSDNGPDAHEMTVCCDHCNGAGTIDAAYEGVLNLLRRMTTAWHKALPYQVAHERASSAAIAQEQK